MTVGTVAGMHPALEALTGAVDSTRKAAALLSVEQAWTCSAADVLALLDLQAQLDSVVAAIGLALVREVDVHDLPRADGQVSTARWLASKLTLHPGEAAARVKTAEMLSRRATATAAALREGRINPEQARAIARGLDNRSPRPHPRSSPRPRPFCYATGSACTPGTSRVWPATSARVWTRTEPRRTTGRAERAD